MTRPAARAKARANTVAACCPVDRLFFIIIRRGALLTRLPQMRAHCAFEYNWMTTRPKLHIIQTIIKRGI